MNLLISLLVGTLFLVTISLHPAAADADIDQSCIPGSIKSIKTNLMRTLIICYVYGCPDETTRSIVISFDQFNNYDFSPRTDLELSNDTTLAKTSKEADSAVPLKVLSKLAKLTSAIEKDRIAALTACTDYVSLLNKLLSDILLINSKCFLEPQAQYPPETTEEGGAIDCDEMTVYMKQMKKYFSEQCDSKGKDCSEKLKTAVSWFSRAYKQMGKSCYYDAYEYLDR